jgi:hypothetical protein
MGHDTRWPGRDPKYSSPEYKSKASLLHHRAVSVIPKYTFLFTFQKLHFTNTMELSIFQKRNRLQVVNSLYFIEPNVLLMCPHQDVRFYSNHAPYILLHSDLPSGLFPSDFPVKTQYALLIHATRLAQVLFLSPGQYFVKSKISNLLIKTFFSSLLLLSPS